MTEQRIVLANPPVDGTRDEKEAWAKVVIDSMRPRPTRVGQMRYGNSAGNSRLGG